MCDQKLELLERIRSEQQDLRCAREAYDSLHHTHAELLSQAALAAEHTRGAQVEQAQRHTSTSSYTGRGAFSERGFLYDPYVPL